MRAFTLISGLFLTSVLAAPTPRPTNDLTDANPFNTGIERRLDLPKLPVDLPTAPTLPTLPIKGLPAADIPTVDSAKKTTGTVTTSATDALSPALKAVGVQLSSALANIEKAETGVKTLLSNTKSNVSGLVSSIQTNVNIATTNVKSALEILGVDTSNIFLVRSIVEQLQASADTLVHDVEQLDTSLPGVNDLVTSAKSLVAGVQSLGL